jgi:hypothetical protein
MKRVLGLGYLLAFSLMVLGFSSCSTDGELDPEQQLSQAELKTILESDDISGAADTVLADLFINDGASGKSAPDCHVAEYTDTGYVVTFNNCVLNGTDNANGSLTVVYGTEQETASFTATFDGFYVGEVELNGSRNYTFNGNVEQNSYSFSVSSQMTATMADGTEIAENGTKIFGITFGETFESTIFTIEGNWTLVVDGNTYAVEVNDALQGNLVCAHLVSGTMDISKNGLEVTVDFGDGSCDDIATIIYPNGATEDVSLDD